MAPEIRWPGGKRFAFTIFDDTDFATTANVGPVYAFLADGGFRTTKSVWLAPGDPEQRASGRAGDTCQDAGHLRWLLDLQAKGFEIAWHNATWNGVPRPQILAALERFAELFGHDPASGANHSDYEAIYWGAARLSGWRALAYRLLTRFRYDGRFRGHVEGDDFFWGDLCKEKIKYYRNFVFRDINTLKACPCMPYHDALRPWVNYWFASADGNAPPRFKRCLCEAAQDRLEEEGGACIMYTHFACGFAEGGGLDPEFRALMTRLSKKNGWFVPVGTLLDHLLAVRGRQEITAAQRRRLERKWLVEKVMVGTD